MFERLSLKDFALFKSLTWQMHAPINVIVGRNDTGKSHLLKILYCLARSVQEFSRKTGQTEGKSWGGIISKKLQWTFQPEEMRHLVHVGAKQFQVSCILKGHRYEFTLSPSEKLSSSFGLHGNVGAVQDKLNAIFIPPKELLTAFDAIAATREQLEIYGFDDTYFDLIRAMRLPATRGKIDPNLKEVLASLEALFGGVIEKSGERFYFKRGEQSFAMAQTAEGIKKVGILTTLIRNRTLNQHSILFLDEPETNLHPAYIRALVDMLMLLSQAGVQIYLATHSYFVIKQLHILAKEQARSVVFCSLQREGTTVRADFDDLKNGMPDNPIIDEAIALYQREVILDLKR